MKTVRLYGSEQYIIAELLKRSIEEKKRILDLNSESDSANKLIQEIDAIGAQITLHDIKRHEVLLQKIEGEDNE